MFPLPAITIQSAAFAIEPGAPQLPVGTVGGVVMETANGLAVRAGAVRIPLPQNAPFAPGQSVDVTRAAAGSAVEVRASAQAPAPAVREGSLTELLARVLAHIEGAETRSPQALASLVPRFAPLTEMQTRQVVALFAARGALGPQLGALAAHVQAAIGAGWIAPDWARAFLALAQVEAGAEPEAIAAWLRQTTRAATRSPEAALAQGAPGDAAGSLLAQVRLLRQDAGLRAVLQRLNREPGFLQTAEGAIERLEGHQLHQLQGLDTSYVFAELPSPFGEEASSIQLHWFAGNGGGGSGASGPETVVLDLSLSRLGALWVTLQTAGSHCQCALRATDPTALHVLAAEAPALEAALVQSGYATAAVRVEAWDGDRLGEAARLMRRTAGLDVQA